MKYSKWTINQVSPAIPEELLALGYTPLLAALLAQRGFTDAASAREFVSGGAELLRDGSLMADMPRAAERVREAIASGETVAVYGDYDVDGITSACLVTSYLRSRGLSCLPYIPSRLGEGYGLNSAALDTIKAAGASLVITVDCGITAVQEAEHARSLGLDLIITDHHECGSHELPQAYAVVDPKRPDCPYPNKSLAGVGVAFKLLCAVDGDAGALLDEYADLVAAGTVADVMPLTDENRYLVRRGLAKLNSDPRPGVEALLSECGGKIKRLNATTVGFTIAPRINAAGRLGNAALGARLLLSRTYDEALPLAKELCRLNRERQELEQEIWVEAHELLRRSPPTEPIVLASESWHQGVIGIAASRLAEEYGLPCVMICIDGGHGKGSCRSFGGFNLFDALAACSDCLEGFGGHALAAGLTIKPENIDLFRERLAEYYRSRPRGERPPLVCELEIDDPELLSMDCVGSLELLEPCGTANPQPVLYLSDMLLERLTPIAGGHHLRLMLSKAGERFDCVMFGMTMTRLGLREGERVDAAFTPQINEYHGRRSVQLLMADLRPAEYAPQFAGMLAGSLPDGWSCAEHLPGREDFVRVWRWLGRYGGELSCALPELRSMGAPGVAPLKTALCLRAMSEAGLLSAGTEGDRLAVRVKPGAEKADLPRTPVMRRAREAAAGFLERRRKLWLTRE